MNTSLSFRKEAIQRSSSASETLNHAPAGAPGVRGQRQAREQRNPAITTILTLTIPNL